MNQTAFSSYDEMLDGQGAVRAAYLVIRPRPPGD
jgi:hypothetical protein